MYYSGYFRRRGCPNCGVGNNNNFRNRQSPNYFNSKRYIHTVKYDSESQDINKTFNPYNDRQRFMTPPRNNSNFNFNNNYSNIDRHILHNLHSPMRNTGCKNCSMSSSRIYNENNYQKPYTRYIMNRTSNLYNYNNIGYKNNRNDESIDEQDDNDEDDDEDEEIISEVSFHQNRNYSPIRNPLRNLKYSFSSEKIISNPNIDNDDYSYNNLNTFSNYNKNIRFNNNRYNDNFNHNLNNIRNILNNKYRNLLDDNIENTNYNRNNYLRNDNRNNYYRDDNRNYFSPDFRNNRNNYNNTFNNAKSIDFTNSRFNYLISKDNRETENDTDRFFTLNIFNFSRKIGEMIEERKTFFIYIFGSRDYTGQSWCSDCNIARPNVERAKNLIKNKKYEREVYFISIPIEKIYMEDLGNDPIIQLERVPTLIFFENGIERNRLIENDLFSFQVIYDFIKQAYNQYNNNRNQYLYRQRNYY